MAAVPRNFIDAGLAAVAAFGLRKVAISDVADRAGVSRATAYRTFGSKQHMLDTLVTHELGRFFDAAQREFHVEGTPEVRLAAALDFAVTWLRTHPVMQRILREEPELLAGALVERPDAPSYVRMTTDRLAAMLEADPVGGQLRASPAELAEIMVRLTISLVLAPRSVFVSTEAMAHVLLTGAGPVGRSY